MCRRGLFCLLEDRQAVGITNRQRDLSLAARPQPDPGRVFIDRPEHRAGDCSLDSWAGPAHAASHNRHQPDHNSFSHHNTSPPHTRIVRQLQRTLAEIRGYETSTRSPVQARLVTATR